MLQLKARRRKKDDERSSTQHRRHAVEPTLRRQDAFGRAVPGSGGARQETLPDAWRRAGNGRSPLQQECADAWAIYPRSDRGAPAAASLAAAIARADSTDRVIGRSLEIVAWRARRVNFEHPGTAGWDVNGSTETGGRRAGDHAEPFPPLEARGRRAGPDGQWRPPAARIFRGQCLGLRPAKRPRSISCFFCLSVERNRRRRSRTRSAIDSGARRLFFVPGFVFASPHSLRDIRRLSTSPSRILEPPSLRAR